MTSSHPSIDDLTELTPSQLKALFQELIGRPVPSRVSRDFLIGNIAWAIQAKHRKNDPRLLRKALVKKGSRSKRAPLANVGQGTRLIREWQGETYEVTVLENGFSFQGNTYRSLSRIAQEITGAHWSGPRFFGVPRAGS